MVRSDLSTSTYYLFIEIWQIDLSANYIGRGGVDGVKALADALRVNASVTECDLRENYLGAEGWTTLFTALSKSSVSKVTKWDLSGQSGIKESVKSLAEYISVSASITQACQIRKLMRCVFVGMSS